MMHWLHELRLRFQEAQTLRSARQATRRRRLRPSVSAEPLECRILLSGLEPIGTEPVDGAPVFDSDTYSFSVEENCDLGTYVGTVSATDPEGDAVTYSIVSGGDGKFQIDSATGEITTAGELDRETTDFYSLTVEASDGTNTSTTTVEITVTDVNEAPIISNFVAIDHGGNIWTFEGDVWDESPAFLTITFGGVLEGHTCIVDAVDAYTGSFSYTLTLDPETEGLVTAQTTDEFGLLSNLAEDAVIQG